MSIETPVKQYIYRNNLNGTKTEFTHLCLDKGKAKIDFGLPLQNFHRCLAWNYLKGNTFSISQRRTHIFNLFLDIDFPSENELNDESITDICQFIQKIVTSVLDTNSFTCHVSKTKDYKILKDSRLGYSIHMHWCDIQITVEIARRLRDVLVQKLLLDKPGHEWRTIIDEHVFIGSGLKTLFSYKAELCKKCKDYPKNEICQNCIDMGHTYSRPHVPFIILDKDSNVSQWIYDTTVDSVASLIDKTCIRADTLEPNCKLIEPIGSWFVPSKLPLNRPCILPRKGAKGHVNDTMSAELAGIKMGTMDTFIDILDPRFTRIEQHIQEYWPVYSTLRITGMSRHKYYGKFAYHIRTDQHYCHCIGREHDSNHIWFRIYAKERVIVQKCFDQDTCLGYTTNNQSLGIPKDLWELLFPEVAICKKRQAEESRIGKEKIPHIPSDIFKLNL